MAFTRIYLWKQGNYPAMSQHANNYESQMVSICLTSDDLWGAFCDVLYEAIGMFVSNVETQNNNDTRAQEKVSIKHSCSVC